MPRAKKEGRRGGTKTRGAPHSEDEFRPSSASSGCSSTAMVVGFPWACFMVRTEGLYWRAAGQKSPRPFGERGAGRPRHTFPAERTFLEWGVWVPPRRSRELQEDQIRHDYRIRFADAAGRSTNPRLVWAKLDPTSVQIGEEPELRPAAASVLPTERSTRIPEIAAGVDKRAAEGSLHRGYLWPGSPRSRALAVPGSPRARKTRSAPGRIAATTGTGTDV